MSIDFGLRHFEAVTKSDAEADVDIEDADFKTCTRNWMVKYVRNDMGYL